MVFNATFNYTVTDCFIGGGNWSTRTSENHRPALQILFNDYIMGTESQLKQVNNIRHFFLLMEDSCSWCNV